MKCHLSDSGPGRDYEASPGGQSSLTARAHDHKLHSGWTAAVHVEDKAEPPGTPAGPCLQTDNNTSAHARRSEPHDTRPPLSYRLRYRGGDNGEWHTAECLGNQTGAGLYQVTQEQPVIAKVQACDDTPPRRWRIPAGLRPGTGRRKFPVLVRWMWAQRRTPAREYERRGFAPEVQTVPTERREGSLGSSS